MSTIMLYADKVNRMPGLLSDAKKAVRSYKSDLTSLKNKVISIDRSVCNVDNIISTLQSSTQTQEQKITSLDNFKKQSDEFIADTVRADNNVAEAVEKRKDEFYDKFSYLKPECEKDWKEKTIDWFDSAGAWCKEHWKAIVTAVIVVVAIVGLVVLSFIPGGGILAGIIAGACWGAISGALFGGIFGGIASVKSGGSFWKGFENGAFSGAIGGAVGGAITGGFTAALGPATSMMQSIGRGIGLGALSTGTSNMLVTGLEYVIKYGTIVGSLDDILISGFFGALSGGIIGGVFSIAGVGVRALKNRNELSRISKLEWREKGKEFTKLAKSKFSSKTVNGDEITINLKNGARTRLDFVTKNSFKSKLRLYEFKGSKTAPFTEGQLNSYASNGNKLTASAVFTKKGLDIFGNMKLFKGQKVVVIRPEQIKYMNSTSPMISGIFGGVNSSVANLFAKKWEGYKSYD